MTLSANKSKIINFIALVLGCVVGCILNITRYTSYTYTIFAPLGSLYIRVLQFVTLPMIFCLIVVSKAILPRRVPTPKKIIFFKSCDDMIETTIRQNIIGKVTNCNTRIYNEPSGANIV